MTEIETLYHKTYADNNRKDPKFYIDTYESNRDLIEGSDTSTSNPDYDGIMRLTADYALSLSIYGSSTKSLPYLDKAIGLFQNSSTKDLVKVPIYEMLIWTRGMENYNAKKYSIATKDFDYLVDNYPDNDKYKQWLYASKTIRATKYLNILWGLTVFCFVWASFIKSEDEKFKYILIITAIIAGILAILTEIAKAIIKFSIKENKRSNGL